MSFFPCAHRNRSSLCSCTSNCKLTPWVWSFCFILFKNFSLFVLIVWFMQTLSTWRNSIVKIMVWNIETHSDIASVLKAEQKHDFHLIIYLEITALILMRICFVTLQILRVIKEIIFKLQLKLLALTAPRKWFSRTRNKKLLQNFKHWCCCYKSRTTFCTQRIEEKTSNKSMSWEEQWRETNEWQKVYLKILKTQKISG
jgi:hypothetical protein